MGKSNSWSATSTRRRSVSPPTTLRTGFVTDRLSGFTANEISDLTRISHRLGFLADLRNHRRIVSNILAAYLGSKTGPKVLAGQIRRGTGEEITAVLWSSDLRGFTERSDRLEGVQVITMLNALFDAQAKAIVSHGGEILKFIGDGLLCIFPIDSADKARAAARSALAAAMEAVEAVRGPNTPSSAEPSRGKRKAGSSVLKTPGILSQT